MAEETAYGAKTANKLERLVVGPRGPRERHAIRALRDAIQPAYDFVLNLAKRVAKLSRRERAAETRAAELARPARVLEREARRMRLDTSGLDDIAADRDPARLTAVDFPQALAVTDRDRADTSGLQKRLDAMPNMDLYVAARATAEARRLSDGAPALRTQFARGAAVLELSAKQRGLDLETGRHAPNKATDPHRARLHVDVAEARFRRRIWRKIHCGVDEQTLEVRAVEITESHIGDALVLPDLLGQIAPNQVIGSVTADGAYDMRNCHDANADRGAHAVIPPRRNGRPWKPTTAGAIARNEALRASKYLGRAI